MRTRTLASLSLLASVMGSTGCELIAAVDHDLIVGQGGALGGGGAGTGGTPVEGGGGEGGTGGAGCDVATCPDAPECQVAVCDGDMCAVDDETSGTSCDLVATDDGVCDGSGTCVECLTNAECTAPETCDTVNHVCVPEHCTNGDVDEDETDEDCGGADCAACGNGLMCAGDDTNCLSGFCNATVCAACTVADCPADQFCDLTDNGGTCKDDKPDGQACTTDDECTNSHCNTIGGGTKMCCDVDCSAGCSSCAAADTGGTNGVCDDVTNGTDAKNACPTVECQTGVCQAGACGNSPNTMNCGTGPTCVTDDLKPQDKCNGSGACVSPANVDCMVYSCDAAASPDVCFTSCLAHTSCAASGTPTGNYCVGIDSPPTLGTTAMTCQAKKIAASPCNQDIECISGTCSGANICL